MNSPGWAWEAPGVGSVDFTWLKRAVGCRASWLRCMDGLAFSGELELVKCKQDVLFSQTFSLIAC